MTTGIILAVLFILLAGGNIVSKHINNQNVRRSFIKIHKVVGILFVLLILTHFLLTITLIKQRPIAMYVLGFIMLAAAIIEVFSFYFRKYLKRKWLLIHKIMAGVILFSICIHIYVGISSLNAYQNKISVINIPGLDLSQIEDGIYEGEYDAGYVYAKVKVVVNKGVIERVDLLEHRTERGKKAECIPMEIVKQQTVAVDAVSGATNSSKVIEQAVYNALLRGYSSVK